MDEEPVAVVGELADLSGIQVGDLLIIEGSVLGDALERIFAETDEPDKDIARFANRI